MRIVKQIRYFKDGETGKNYPSDIDGAKLSSGAAFSMDGYSIVQLGIQTLPGVQFTLNGGTSSMVVGQTGIYEIELSDSVRITQLQFYGSSLSLISSNEGAYLIVDLIYESNN